MGSIGTTAPWCGQVHWLDQIPGGANGLPHRGQVAGPRMVQTVPCTDLHVKPLMELSHSAGFHDHE
jgi:hypothetical protein